jgi:hypothetical protein
MLTKFKNANLIFALMAGIFLNSCNQSTTKNDDSQEENTPQVEKVEDHAKTNGKIKENDFSKIALYHHVKATFSGSKKSLNWLKEKKIALYHHAKATFSGSKKSLDWLKENNIALYHHAKATFSGSNESLNWLKN